MKSKTKEMDKENENKLMQAIEFTTIIKNGVIQIPEKYNKFTGQSARIIVLTDNDNTNTQDVEAIENLLKTTKQRKIFDKITDPVSWQRSLSDEWE